MKTGKRGQRKIAPIGKEWKICKAKKDKKNQQRGKFGNERKLYKEEETMKRGQRKIG